MLYKSVKFSDSFAIQILKLLKPGGVSLAELKQSLRPRPSALNLRIYLEFFECMGLAVRDRSGAVDRWWVNGEGLISLSEHLAECAKGLTPDDHIFVKGLSSRAGNFLKIRKLFIHEHRIKILEQIAIAPCDVFYIWKKLKASCSRDKILKTLSALESSGIAVSRQKTLKTPAGILHTLEFSATPLGVDVAQLLRSEKQRHALGR